MSRRPAPLRSDVDEDCANNIVFYASRSRTITASLYNHYHVISVTYTTEYCRFVLTSPSMFRMYHAALDKTDLMIVIVLLFKTQ